MDDNATNREIVTRHVRSWAMDPVAAALPSAALALLDAGEAFDLGVLDLAMPEMDGLALAREIRQRRPDLPLVLFTSLGRLPHVRTATEFDAQLSKPLKASQLFDAIVEVIAGRVADRPTRADGAAVPTSSSGSCSPRTTQ